METRDVAAGARVNSLTRIEIMEWHEFVSSYPHLDLWNTGNFTAIWVDFQILCQHLQLTISLRI